MATLVENSTQHSGRRALVRSRFFLWLATICAAIAILGFMPTYWLQLPARTFVGPPLLHIHAALNTAWVLFLISQAWLVSEGRLRNHRNWGLAGISLASVVVVVGFATAIESLNYELAHGGSDAARAFFTVPIFSMTVFAGFTASAIACTRRPEWHKRLIIAGTVSLVGAAAGRVGFLIGVGHGPGLRPGLLPPPPQSLPVIAGLLMQLILIAGMVHDKRSRGSIHPAWTVALSVSIAAILLQVPLSHTAGWLAFADWTTHMAG
ncbi:MAG TPA: hypothetical protein VJ846_11960 [Sphingomicrobium sp.]|nr:hypothetical protein [Sphingomicrobium sp.]